MNRAEDTLTEEQLVAIGAAVCRPQGGVIDGEYPVRRRPHGVDAMTTRRGLFALLAGAAVTPMLAPLTITRTIVVPPIDIGAALAPALRHAMQAALRKMTAKLEAEILYGTPAPAHPFDGFSTWATGPGNHLIADGVNYQRHVEFGYAPNVPHFRIIP